jgi:hypothetical protein
MKVKSIDLAKNFEDIPNVGVEVAKDFLRLGIKKPKDLVRKDPLVMYKKLCKLTKTRQDPCVLDTFIAVVDFADNSVSRPWWFYTKQRKTKYGDI